MDSRKQKLLTYIIDAYIKTAQAVGSAFIADKYMKDGSGPTIRNWMQELEKDGYITHKHTSAGRVPTEKGYRYYLKNLHKKDISDKDQKALDKVHTSVVESDEKVKTVAKKIAELSGGAVVISFSPNEVYHTGLSNLFSHPEFENQDVVVHMSEMIEQLDEVMTGITKQIDDEVSVLIGSDNPFGQECGVVLSVLEDGVVIGILGPMRMNYSQNVGLVKYIKYLLSV
jgi:heat-inducible transcriptional repressor